MELKLNRILRKITGGYYISWIEYGFDEGNWITFGKTTAWNNWHILKLPYKYCSFINKIFNDIPFNNKV